MQLQASFPNTGPRETSRLDVAEQIAYGHTVTKKTDFPDWHGFGTTEQFRRWGLVQGVALLVCFAALLIFLVAIVIWSVAG